MAKLVSIQYLRAIAALLVVASHALLYPLDYHDTFDERLGWLGVILFFVVSGFIMVSVTGEGRFDLVKFLKRRLLRIVPLYWGFTFLAAILALALPEVFKTTVFDFVQLVLSLLFIPFHNPASEGFHPLYKLGWTLNYEMYFYVCFAALAFLSARTRVVALTIAFVLATAFGFVSKPTTGVAGFYTSYMPLAFVVGDWIGLFYIEGRLAVLAKGAGALLAVFSVAALAQGFLTNTASYVDPFAFIGLVLGAGLILTIAVGWDALLPHWPMLEYLGDASYLIYLAHIFAVGVVEGAMLRIMGHADGAVMAGAVIGAIVCGVLLGVLVYKVAEKPLMQRLRGLARS